MEGELPCVVYKTQKQTNLWPEVVGGQDVFVLRPGSSPGVVQFETLVAEVGLTVGAAFSGLQGLRGFTETTHDGHTAQTYRLPVPGWQIGRHRD